MGELILTRHQKYVDIVEAGDQISIPLSLFAAGFDPAFCKLTGDRLFLWNGECCGRGHVTYQIDGWDSKDVALTATKIEDTRGA